MYRTCNVLRIWFRDKSSLITHPSGYIPIMATEKNKKPIVPPHEVTISDFTIGFSVVDLVVTRFVW